MVLQFICFSFYFIIIFFFINFYDHIYQTKEGFIFRLSKVNVLIPRIYFVQRISLLEGDAMKEILKQLTRFQARSEILNFSSTIVIISELCNHNISK